MPDTQLAWGGSNRLGSLALDVPRLRAEGAPVYPQLIVPLRLAITTDAVAEGRGKLRLWSVSCSLFQNTNLLSDHQGDVLDLHCYANDSGQEIQLRFPLDLSRLEHIERLRMDDLPFALRGKLVLEVTRDQPTVEQPRPQPSTSPVPSGLFAVSFQLDFVVPRSQWTTALLPRLGWSAIRIVELPVPTTPAWKETFSMALTELDEAQRLFKEGNFDQTVAHCRSAIEPFRKKAQDLKQTLKDARSSAEVAAKEFGLLHAMASDTADWLTGQLERHHTLASVAHHVPAVGHFSRDQAHALLLHTTALVIYAGQALTSPAPKQAP
jgi:hypothetical protein